MGVAIIAVAAGAFARTRPSQNAALVGVAVAVALVPPLASAGLMLEESHWKPAPFNRFNGVPIVVQQRG